MRFWDSSALVPLLLEERSSSTLRTLLRQDPEHVVWWGSEVECMAAIMRQAREGHLDDDEVTAMIAELERQRRRWHPIQPVDSVREQARRFLRVHALRAADALQLAAALVAAEGRPSTLDLVCLDRRLAEAARREGFAVYP